MRNPFGKSYGPSARAQYAAKGSQRALDAEIMAEAAQQLAAEKAELAGAQAEFDSANNTQGRCKKCGGPGTGIWCNKHAMQLKKAQKKLDAVKRKQKRKK